MVKKKKRFISQSKMKVDPNTNFSYKHAGELRRFVNSQGNILPRDIAGLPAKKQKQLARAIKRARHLALLPFTQTF